MDEPRIFSGHPRLRLSRTRCAVSPGLVPPSAPSHPLFFFAMAAGYICPVCDYPKLSEPPRSEFGGGSFEICPSCGFQFGVNDDDEGISYETWRRRWEAAGMPWTSIALKKPDSWHPMAKHVAPGGAALRRPGDEPAAPSPETAAKPAAPSPASAANSATAKPPAKPPAEPKAATPAARQKKAANPERKPTATTNPKKKANSPKATPPPKPSAGKNSSASKPSAAGKGSAAKKSARR